MTIEELRSRIDVLDRQLVELIERSTPEASPGAVARFIKGLHLPQAELAR